MRNAIDIYIYILALKPYFFLLIHFKLVTTGLAHHLVDGIRRQMSKWNHGYRGNREFLTQ